MNKEMSGPGATRSTGWGLDGVARARRAPVAFPTTDTARLPLLAIIAVALAGCASLPDMKADNVKDGTVQCATATGLWGTAKGVTAKLDERVIRDGGHVRVDANCVMDIQLMPPLPKAAPPKEPAK